MASLDGVIEDIGLCGPFQSLLTVATYSTAVVSVWGMMLMAFGSYNPGWVCLDRVSSFDNVSSNNGDDTDTISYDTSTAGTGRPRENNATDTCELYSMYDTSTAGTGRPRENNATDTCELYSRCANVSFLPGASTVVSEWGLVCDHKWTPSIIFTVQMVGVLLGAYIAGHLGESVGRKACLYGMVALHGLSNLLAVFSPSWQVFAAVRFFIGMSVGGILTTSFMIPLEFMNQFWRGIVGSIPTWNIGAASFAIGVALLKDWRQLHLISAALSALVFLPVFWVPESLRWLTVHGKDTKAGVVATNVARMNKRPLPNLEHLKELVECERRRALVDSSKRYSYTDLFRDSSLRKTTVIVGFVWISLAFVYYGISFGVQALSGDFYTNFLILSVMEVPATLFVLPTLLFLNRRWGSAILFLAVSMACFGILLVTVTMGRETRDLETKGENPVKENIVMVLTVIARLGNIGAWGVVTVFCGELFPTAVRNLGFGYANALARIGGMLGPVLFPQDPALFHVAMASIGILSLLCAGSLLLLPETKGAPLEDMILSKNPLRKLHSETVIMNIQHGEKCVRTDVEGNGNNVALIKVENL